ncbi:ParB/RepB/Spo0J family partition protein [Enterovibrio norvegicus]|uniref:ParB/RepB/Spo0J family partition protein n=1 Tax=Enterovibrio norvegicus TaxID=188144 RepID=UPI0013043B97|nr:ParB/RepB/Spo0J family partition protein [Enterovibrio norvegicus]
MNFFDQLATITDETPKDTEKSLYQIEVELVSEITAANDAYRSGTAIMSDADYDAKMEQLATVCPSHSFLQGVEPEPLSDNTHNHLSPMLSTQKAYKETDINKWADKIEQAGRIIGDSDPVIRCTPKLDGVACHYLTIPLLATRGNGWVGNVITDLLSKGLVIVGNTSKSGVGEIVVSTAYFEQHLSSTFSHPRNFIAGLVNAKNLSEEALKALADGAVELVMFGDMPAIEVPLSTFRKTHKDIEAQLSECDYPIDGIVYESKNMMLKTQMGANNHHHHWQVAKKVIADEKTTVVTDITYQIGRSGQITPVIHFEPVDLGGAITSKVTGHHVGNVLANKIGVGASISVYRAGMVIPYLNTVLTPASETNVPSCCPQCLGEVEMKNDHLYCMSDTCGGQDTAAIIHHFDIIGAKLFGKVTTSKLVSNGFDTVESVYQMSQADFETAGLGSGQATNLLGEIERVKREPMADYLLLASLGISKLGRGSAKKLLRVYPINEVQNLTAEQLIDIEGFGENSASSITSTLSTQTLLPFLLQQGFNITHTKDANSTRLDSNTFPLSGKKVVFTGTCSVSRTEMVEFAQGVGCQVQDRVTKDTDFLVCGLNVGASKTEGAEKKGVTVIEEFDFYELATPPASQDTEVTGGIAFEEPELTCETSKQESEAMNMQSQTSTVEQGNKNIQDGELIYLDPRTLKVPSWGNPRVTLAESDYAELLASVKTKGVHTPIFVRPVEGGHEIIAGNTRRRAAIEAELPLIPCLSRVMNDTEAFELAVSENVDRTQMTVLDEAESLKRIVKNHNGDIQAAATEMGWAKPRFDRALQLLRASDLVRENIGKKQDNGFMLTITHAARLSILPSDVQDKILPAILRDKMSAAVLAEKIAKSIKRPLATALFCKNDCANCSYNSEVQTSMFGDDNGAECSNTACYTKKTNEHFEEQRQTLEKEYGKIVLLSTVAQPINVNRQMVGDEQFNNGCLSCDKHCAILADCGTVQGNIIENQCLDSACANTHAKAHQQSIAKMATQTTANSATTAPEKSKATSSTVTKKEGTANTAAKLPKRLIMDSQTDLRAVGKDLLLMHPSYQLAMTLSVLMSKIEGGYDIENAIIEYMALEPVDIEKKIVEAIEKITNEVQADSFNMERTIIRAANKHVKGFKNVAVKAWQPTQSRLLSMTKTVREQVLENSGFAAEFKAQKGDKAYASMMNKKSDDAVSDILAFEFEWTNYAPEYYVQAIQKQRYNF